MVPIENVHIESSAFKADPYPFYARLRAEAPVCRIRLPDRREAWLVARYDDVLALMKDSRFRKDRRNLPAMEGQSRQTWLPPGVGALMQNMLDRDDPDHARLRRLVQTAFTPRRIDLMEERILTLSEVLLDKAEARGTFDLIHDFALPLPLTVIADLMGVPEQDRLQFARWSKALIGNTQSAWDMLRSAPPMLAFVRYVRQLVRQRRTVPQDDLVSALVQAEEDGEGLSEDEIVAMIVLLLTAGHETTVNLIGNGMLALMQHPRQMERLRTEPSLIKSAVEELLRYTSPVDLATLRYAGEDIEIAGVWIPQGTRVIGVIGSANRDERSFPAPDVLDITRTPNRHLTFGQGLHYCLGAPLARMEGQIAINTLLRRFPALQPAVSLEAVRWRRGLLLRGLESLPMTAQPSSPSLRHGALSG